MCCGNCQPVAVELHPVGPLVELGLEPPLPLRTIRGRVRLLGYERALRPPYRGREPPIPGRPTLPNPQGPRDCLQPHDQLAAGPLFVRLERVGCPIEREDGWICTWSSPEPASSPRRPSFSGRSTPRTAPTDPALRAVRPRRAPRTRDRWRSRGRRSAARKGEGATSAQRDSQSTLGAGEPDDRFLVSIARQGGTDPRPALHPTLARSPGATRGRGRVATHRWSHRSSVVVSQSTKRARCSAKWGRRRRSGSPDRGLSSHRRQILREQGVTGRDAGFVDSHANQTVS